MQDHGASIDHKTLDGYTLYSVCVMCVGLIVDATLSVSCTCRTMDPAWTSSDIDY